MTGLREEKKERTRSAILAAARELFEERGYAGATTAEIARRAGIAEGTVFNYFTSKAEILVQLVYAVFKVDRYATPGRPAGRSNVVDRLLGVLDHHLSPAQDVGKPWLREMYAIALSGGPESRYVLDRLSDMDGAIGREIRADLDHLRGTGVFGADVDFDGFMDIAYRVVMVDFAEYLLVDELSYMDFRAGLRDRLALLVRSILFTPGATTAATAATSEHHD